MVLEALKSVSSVVRPIIGRVTVYRWMMVPRMRRNEILEPTHMARGPASNTHSSRDEKCSSDSFCVIHLCGAAIYPVQNVDEC